MIEGSKALGASVAVVALFCCFQLKDGAGHITPRDGHSIGLAASALHTVPNLAGDDWQVKTERNGMSAQVAGDAQTPDGTARTTLSFQCAPGKGGTSTITFTVLGAVRIKGFDFDEFEGPDAPAQRRSLVTITAHQPARDLVIKTACSGYYTVSDEGFAFEVTTMANVHGTVNQLSDALIRGATSITVRVQGLKHPEKTIESTYQARRAAAVLGQVMHWCGRS